MTTKLTKAQASALLDQAFENSAKAAAEHDATLPPEQQRGLDCGFAWATIRPARGPIVSELKRRGIGSTRQYGGGGYEIWYSKLHRVSTQSVSTHEAAAAAFAKTLIDAGVEGVSTGSRLD